MENIKPLVSISCITYNHGPYIRQCLEGFMMQKTNFAFEVLIHDDASTDGTTEIIKEFEAKYPDIIKPIYEEENQWVKGRRGSAEFNFPRAQGKYIALCEGDDYWIDPLKLQKQVDFMEKHDDFTMCFHAAEIIGYEEKRSCSFVELEEREYKAVEFFKNWIIPTASVLFRNGIKIYSDSRFVVGDNPLFLSCAMSGKIYCITNIPMSAYRIVSGSAVSKGWIWEKQINHFLAIKEHFKKLNISNEVDDKIVSTYFTQILFCIKNRSFKDMLAVLKHILKYNIFLINGLLIIIFKFILNKNHRMHE